MAFPVGCMHGLVAFRIRGSMVDPPARSDLGLFDGDRFAFFH